MSIISLDLSTPKTCELDTLSFMKRSFRRWLLPSVFTCIGIFLYMVSNIHIGFQTRCNLYFWYKQFKQKNQLKKLSNSKRSLSNRDRRKEFLYANRTLLFLLPLPACQTLSWSPSNQCRRQTQSRREWKARIQGPRLRWWNTWNTWKEEDKIRITRVWSLCVVILLRFL